MLIYRFSYHFVCFNSRISYPLIYLKPEKVPLSGGASLINVIGSHPPRIGVFRTISDNKLNFILCLIYLHSGIPVLGEGQWKGESIT